ncbi:MAG: hypothetical protein ACFCUI_13670 [Bernardetiaceae bacterium]
MSAIKNTGNFEEIDGDITIGNGNYSYKNNIVINSPITKELLREITEGELYRRYDTLSLENQAYRDFLYLDRQNISERLFKVSDSEKLLYVRTYAGHQPDWLFDRWVLELREENQETSYQPRKLSELPLGRFLGWIKMDKPKNLLDIPERIKNATHLLQMLEEKSPKATHLLGFFLDINREDMQALPEFEKAFFDFWQLAQKTTDIEYRVFLCVKVRCEQATPQDCVCSPPPDLSPGFRWPWQSKKTAPPPSPLPKPIEDFTPIKTTDVEQFFENRLKTLHIKAEIKEPCFLLDAWRAFLPEISRRYQLNNP